MAMVPETITAIITGIVQFYLVTFIWGLFTIITEWDKIIAPNSKKILYLFTYPFFMFTYLPIAFFCTLHKGYMETNQTYCEQKQPQTSVMKRLNL